jgi:hypothetical protein
MESDAQHTGHRSCSNVTAGAGWLALVSNYPVAQHSILNGTVARVTPTARYLPPAKKHPQPARHPTVTGGFGLTSHSGSPLTAPRGPWPMPHHGYGCLSVATGEAVGLWWLLAEVQATLACASCSAPASAASSATQRHGMSTQ